MVKKIAMAALLALTFLPAASFAQVIVRIAPPARLLSVVRHRRIAVMSGLTVITAGMAPVMFG